MPYNYIFIYMFILIFCIIIPENNRKKFITAKFVKRKSCSKKEKIAMLELAKKFIEKECIFYLLNGQTNGIIKEVSNNGILIQVGNDMELINSEFIMRIREYPRNKKGKKKSFVI